MLGLESHTFLLLLISLGHFSVAKPSFSSGGASLPKLFPTPTPLLCSVECVCRGDASPRRVDGSGEFPEQICTYPCIPWCRPGLLLLPWVFTHRSHPLEYFSFILCLSVLRMLIQGLLFFSFYILFPVCCQWQRNKARTRDAVFRWQSEDDLNALHKSSLRVTFQSLGLTLSAEVLETAYLNDNTCPLGLNWPEHLEWEESVQVTSVE